MARAAIWAIPALWALSCGNSAESSSPASGAGANAGGKAGAASAGSAGKAGSAGSGTGGSSSGGAPAGGSAGTSAGPRATDSLRYACREYLRAACERREACTGADPAGCLTTLDSCPDYLFSPGTTRTRESVLSCADAYRAQACDEVIANKPPACATVGTLPPGSDCLFNSQCAGDCDGFGNCGQCIERAPEDGACSVSIACQPWQACDGVTCLDSPNFTQPERLPGAACEYSCITGYVCARATASAEATCLPNPALAAPCYYEAYDDGDANHGACALDSYCKADFTCAPLPGQGEACADVEPTRARCRFDVCVNGVCPVVDNPGATCSTSSAVDCKGETRCRCPTAEACAQGSCVYVREEAESCTGTHDLCAYGTTCTQGVCVATDALTRFAMCQ